MNVLMEGIIDGHADRIPAFVSELSAEQALDLGVMAVASKHSDDNTISMLFSRAKV